MAKALLECRLFLDTQISPSSSQPAATYGSSHAKLATGNCLASLRADEIHRRMHRCLWNVNKDELISYANCAAATDPRGLSSPGPPSPPTCYRRDSSSKEMSTHGWSDLAIATLAYRTMHDRLHGAPTF